jgi:hypothetical protein
MDRSSRSTQSMHGMSRIVALATPRFNTKFCKLMHMSKFDGTMSKFDETMLKFDGTMSKFDGTFRQKGFVKLESVN